MVNTQEKILIIALPGIGDALLATPMITLLRRSKPDARIEVLVMFQATRDLFLTNPNIDKVHYYDFIKTNVVESFLFLTHLRRESFDISINIYPQNRREYNIFAIILGAKKRLGIRYLRRDWQNMSWLCTDTVNENDQYHCVEENIRILSLLGIKPTMNEETLPRLELLFTQVHISFAADWLIEHQIRPEQMLIGIHAGTALFKNHIMRRWTPDKFAILAKRLKDELGATILLFGGPDDVQANEIILQTAADSVIEVKTKSIMDSIAVMKKLSLFVSNDSALMHIAGAIALPTIAIFGPTNETYVHPWKTQYEVVRTDIECRPCFHYSPKPLICYRSDPAEHFMCIRDIEVEQVFDAVCRLMPVQIQV